MCPILNPGSSPRVRSRLGDAENSMKTVRIISACAEQTTRRSAPGRSSRDHLRVCGADWTVGHRVQRCRGSSPRVRSRRNASDSKGSLTGIISACAEQTIRVAEMRVIQRDHLRVCGADSIAYLASSGSGGSSPRVRSRHVERRRIKSRFGIISACAEQTGILGIRAETT